MNEPKYALCDGRFWWKEDKIDSLITFCETLKEAKAERFDHGDDVVIIKFEGDKIIPLTKKPKLTKEEEEVCAFIFS